MGFQVEETVKKVQESIACVLVELVVAQYEKNLGSEGRCNEIYKAEKFSRESVDGGLRSLNLIIFSVGNL